MKRKRIGEQSLKEMMLKCYGNWLKNEESWVHQEEQSTTERRKGKRDESKEEGC